MAVSTERWADNLEGPWYIDQSCTQCNLCTDIAPYHFSEAESGDHIRVIKQPETEQEVEDCQDALDQCPCEAIGKDG